MIALFFLIRFLFCGAVKFMAGLRGEPPKKVVAGLFLGFFLSWLPLFFCQLLILWSLVKVWGVSKKAATAAATIVNSLSFVGYGLMWFVGKAVWRCDFLPYYGPLFMGGLVIGGITAVLSSAVYLVLR